MGSPDFSILIPTHRGPNTDLGSCLDSILMQDFGSLGAEILVISNLADDRVRREVESRGSPILRYESVGALGINRAKNFGASRSRGRFLLFLDDDCRLSDSGYLNRLHQKILSHPGLSAFGGPYLNPAARPSGATRGYNRMSCLWVDQTRSRNLPEHERTRLLGGGSCFRREIFDSGHRFEEEIRLGGDEAEFFARLGSAGYRFGYFSDLGIIHDADSSWIRAIRRGWGHGRSAVRYRVGSPKPVMSAIRSIRLRELAEDPAESAFLAIHFAAMLSGRWMETLRASHSRTP